MASSFLCADHTWFLLSAENGYTKSHILWISILAAQKIDRTLAFHFTFLTRWSPEKEGGPYRLLKTEIRYPILMHYLSLPLLCKFHSLHQGFVVWILEYDSHWVLLFSDTSNKFQSFINMFLGSACKNIHEVGETYHIQRTQRELSHEAIKRFTSWIIPLEISSCPSPMAL